MNDDIAYTQQQVDELSELARAVAEDIDDLYWKHPVPDDHDYMIAKVVRRIERALILAIRGARHGRWGLANIWSPRTAKGGKGARYLAKPTPRRPKTLLAMLQRHHSRVK